MNRKKRKKKKTALYAAAIGFHAIRRKCRKRERVSIIDANTPVGNPNADCWQERYRSLD